MTETLSTVRYLDANALLFLLLNSGTLFVSIYITVGNKNKKQNPFTTQGEK